MYALSASSHCRYSPSSKKHCTVRHKLCSSESVQRIPRASKLLSRRYPNNSTASPRLDLNNSVSPAVEGSLGQLENNATFDWKDHWYPVVYSYDVGDTQLYPFTLLGVPLVIWRDPLANGVVRAFRDSCPHRLVPLSEGRIAKSGNLECPYHGWQFSGDGTCKVMPQGGQENNARSCATAFQCVERQGMVWVRLKPAAEMSESLIDTIPILPELDDPSWFELAPMWRDLPMDYATLIENVVDTGHVPFTHHASVSKRESSSTLDDLQVTERGVWGFRGFWPTGPRKGNLGPQETLFQGPVLMRHTINALETKGFSNITAVYGVPTTPGRCRLLVRQPFRFKNNLFRFIFGVMPAFMGHLGNLNVLDDDNIFLHMQEKEAVEHGLAEKPVGQVYWMPGASDAYVAAFRTWLERAAGGGPFGPQNAAWLAAAGPRLPQSELLEHYHSHTERCSICKTALARIKLAQLMSGIFGILGLMCALISFVLISINFSTIPSVAGFRPLISLGVAVSIVSALVWGWCSKTIPRFYSGSYPPPRNTVKGEWS